MLTEKQEEIRRQICKIIYEELQNLQKIRNAMDVLGMDTKEFTELLFRLDFARELSIDLKKE
jgi:hypothetical protein